MPSKPSYPYQNLSLENLEGERWKDLPKLDSAYQVSNYGRIKSKRRFVLRENNRGYWTSEKILRQRIAVQSVSEGKRKIRRLCLSISYDAKKITIHTARMVYYLFVKKFDLNDRKIKVSVKDEDPFLIRPDNLFLTSTDVYMKKAYELNRRKRESFGNKGASISQYDLNGRWLNCYPSISKASRAIKASASNIVRALYEAEGCANGYIWSWGKNKKNLPKIPDRIKTKTASEKFHSAPVTSYDMKGNKIKEYKNLKAAARALNVQPNMIRRAIIGDLITTKNRIWRLGSVPEKISMTAILKKIKDCRSQLRRPVTQYTREGKKIKHFESIMAASRLTGVHHMNISGALRRAEQHTAGGFVWLYR